MSESIGSLLPRHRFAEPPEIKIIEAFLAETFQATATILVRERAIVIAVQSAALAGALRPHLLTLQARCNTNKRLIIRIAR